MRVLFIGQDGRSHAICWKLRQSPLVGELYAAPGNPGMAEVADCVPIGVADIIELADFAEKLRIDLTIVGPELPLTLGIVDEFQKRGLTIFGPSRLAAELEASKVFSKEFMRKYGIPTPDATICRSIDEAREVLQQSKYPVVLKVDGLAAGKGVVIPESYEEADQFLKLVFEERRFGNAADRILVEEYLDGEEVSFMVLTDGKRVIPFAPSKDYKRALDEDEGPNTGGMGSHCPSVVLSSEVATEVMRTIINPTVTGMNSEGRAFTGCLYVGLMLTSKGPKVLEYNCRFGNPETQSQILRLEDDLAELLLKVAQGDAPERKLTWKKAVAACVVICAEGYPLETPKMREITIDPIDDTDVILFHGGTRMEGGKLVTSAGRVISVCATAPTLSKALKKVYDAAPKIHFEGAWYRHDIGYRVLLQRRGTF